MNNLLSELKAEMTRADDELRQKLSLLNGPMISGGLTALWSQIAVVQAESHIRIREIVDRHGEAV